MHEHNDMVTPAWGIPDHAADLWDDEFNNLRVIPSSARAAAAKPLRLFSDILPFRRFQTVLDAGCGNGRNAVWLAQRGCTVIAADFSSAALALARRARDQARVTSRVSLCKCSLHDPLPFRPNSIDLVIDSYVWCHFINSEAANGYVKKLWSIVKPGGMIFSSVFSPQDTYYRDMIGPSTDRGPVAIDNHNNIAKQLYSESMFKELFLRYFEQIYFTRIEFNDTVLGKPYRRDILVLVGRRLG